MTNETYGSLPSLFWEGDQGRKIQACGKDAVILSTYLRANRHATMLGLYRLRLDQLLAEQPVLESIDVIRPAFHALESVSFAAYHELTAFVWIFDMARERLSLVPGQVLDPEDKRRKGAQRLFDLLPPSPFIEPFFEAYGQALRLKRRHFAQPDLSFVVSPTVEKSESEGASKPLTSPLQGASAAVASTVVLKPDQEDQENQEVRSDRTAPAHAPRDTGSNETRRTLPMLTVPQSLPADHPSREPNGTNYHVIQKVAWELIRDRDLAFKYYPYPLETLTDFVEVTKAYCAKKRIDYGRHESVPFTVVHRATASVWAQYRLFEPGAKAEGKSR